MSGDALRQLRLRLGLTQAGLARRLGVTANTIARWERDERTPGRPALRLLRLLARHGDADAPRTDGMEANVSTKAELEDRIAELEEEVQDLETELSDLNPDDADVGCEVCGADPCVCADDDAFPLDADDGQEDDEE